jgi:hypothetical protein
MRILRTESLPSSLEFPAPGTRIPILTIGCLESNSRPPVDANVSAGLVDRQSPNWAARTKESKRRCAHY